MIEGPQLYLFIGAALALLLVPGPAVLYITARSASQGRFAGLVSVLAIETANFMQVAAAALGGTLCHPVLVRAGVRYHQIPGRGLEEALTITERCGYVLQGADVNLFLAQYALEQEKDKAKAKGYAGTALKLAYCDGPPYYYKVAYEEAERMLKKLAG